MRLACSDPVHRIGPQHRVDQLEQLLNPCLLLRVRHPLEEVCTRRIPINMLHSPVKASVLIQLEPCALESILRGLFGDHRLPPLEDREVRDDAQGPDVADVVAVPGLRCYVARRALPRRPVASALGEAEVDEGRAAIVLHQDVLDLHIAMRHACSLHTRQFLGNDRQVLDAPCQWVLDEGLLHRQPIARKLHCHRHRLVADRDEVHSQTLGLESLRVADLGSYAVALGLPELHLRLRRPAHNLQSDALGEGPVQGSGVRPQPREVD
mmetsp:Transcript_17985/g.51885  ORF Transcript_17985/g.51885 Transcript_17985/m.51885 type:complete len:266 (-) Transcript_17985:429-1226(-)